MIRNSYDKIMPKINWKDLLNDDVAIINLESMSAIDKMFFIDGVLEDYLHYKSLKGEKMRLYAATYKVLLKDEDEVLQPGLWKVAVVDSKNIQDESYEICMNVFYDLMTIDNIDGRRLKIVDNSKDIDSLNFMINN